MTSYRGRYARFTLLFILLFLLVFCSYIYTGRTFVKGTEDGLRQHLVALTWYGNFLRTLLTGTVIQWDFNIGEGSDVFQTLSYYVIGDPFTLLAVFFPARLMYVCYTLISVLKMYCAGLAFMFLCRHFNVKSGVGTLVAALSYTFSAWVIIHGTRHLYFINPMIYMPLIIVGIDRLLTGRRPVLFTVAVAVAAISNLYFFYMIALLTAVYVLALLVTRHGKDLKAIVCDICRLALYAVTGTMMAMVLVLPVLCFFFSDTRTGLSAIKPFFPPEVYLKLPVMFFVPEGAGYASWMGLSVVVFLGMTALFCKKGEKLLKVLTAVSVLFFIFPIFGQILNGFSYPSHRWCWAFILLCCYVTAKKWDDIVAMGRRPVFWVFCLMTGYFIFFHAVYPKEYHRTISFVCCAFLCIIWLCYSRTEKYSARQAVLIAVAILSIAVNANYRFVKCGWLKTCYPPDKLTVLQKNEATAIKSLGDTGFYRYSGDRLTFNANMLAGLSSPQYYWSMTNRNISEYRRSLGRDNNLGYHRYYDYDSRTMMEALSGVRYFYTKNKGRVPYGFEPVKLPYTYKSDNSLPLGYSYSSYILRPDFEKYPELEKQQILMQSMVLDAPAAAEQRTSFHFDDRKISYEIKPSAGIEVREGKIVVGEENASLKLVFQGLPDAETYLCFKNLNFIGRSSYRFYQYSYYRAPFYIKQAGENREV
ncbi:MAG: YfhO family protein, partial [Spirochaetia bacterium]|nr:YfhO family protein [Spirochaetia bacterium]